MSKVRRSSLVRPEDEITRWLQKEIRKILGKGSKLPAHCKEDEITKLLGKGLSDLGGFYRQPDGALWFFRHHNRQLHEVTTHPDSAFSKYITYVTAQSVKSDLMRRSLDRLHATMLEEAKIVEVHGIAYNSQDLAVIAVNDFDGGMWYRQRGGQWEWKPNGGESILFWTPEVIVQKWVPAFDKGGTRHAEEAFHWFIEQPHFAEHVLTVKDQRSLLRASLLVPLFPSLNPTRPVTAHLGLSEEQQHDTGKTMAGKMIGTVWAGAGFEPTPMDSTDKGKEALSLLLGQAPFVLLDNVDTRTPWLNDYICTYATGQRLTRRKLYSDHTLIHFEPKARLCVTSRKASFNRDDVASRVIPFRFAPINKAERKTERELLGLVIDQRGKIWAGILHVVARLQDGFPSMQPYQQTARLADFDAFGWQVSSIYGEADAWQETIVRLEAAQANFALEDNPFVPILRDWLNQGDIPDMSSSDFFGNLQSRAEECEISWGLPRDAASCTKQMKKLRKLLEAELDVTVNFRTLHGRSHIEIRRGHSWSQPKGEVTGVTGDSLC